MWPQVLADAQKIVEFCAKDERYDVAPWDEANNGSIFVNGVQQ